MKNQNLFNLKHYQPKIILLTVRWYLRYNLSFRNFVEMMEERGLSIAHTTIRVFLPIPPKRGNKQSDTLLFQGVFLC